MEEKDLSVPAKPVKLKRHFILAVIAITLLLIFVGSAIGELPVILLQKLFPNMSGGSAFLLQYLSFIGVDILVLAYCALFEKDIFRSFLHPGQGGSPGNTGKHFALGLLIGFGMNALCILLAWLHGDIHFYTGRFQLLYMLCALVCVCIQSGAEELVTRGYMMGALQKRYPVWVAIATNALLFGALHLTSRHHSAVVSEYCGHRRGAESGHVLLWQHLDVHRRPHRVELYTESPVRPAQLR